MKKVLSLMTLLLCAAMGAWAQDYYTPTADEVIILKDVYSATATDAGYSTHKAVAWAGTASTNSKKAGDPDKNGEVTSNNVPCYSIKGNGGGKNITLTFSGVSKLTLYHEKHSTRYPLLLDQNNDNTVIGTGSSNVYFNEFDLDGTKSYKILLQGTGNGTDKQDLNVYAIKLGKANVTPDPVEPVNKTIFLNPGAWNVENAIERYAAYVWVGEGESKVESWIPFVENSGVLATAIPSSFTGLILARMDGASTENVWDNVWDQTDDIDFTAIADQTIFTITGFHDSPNGKSGYTTQNLLQEAKDKLTKVITLAEMLASNELATDIATAKAALTSTDATEIATAAQTLLEAATPKAKETLGELKTFATTYGYTDLAGQIQTVIDALDVTPIDFDGIYDQITNLVANAKAAAPSIIEKVQGYASALENTELNAAIDAALNTAKNNTSNIKDVIAAVKSAVNAFKVAAAAYVKKISDENIEDANVQAKLAAIVALGTDAGLAEYGEAIRQLIAAYNAYLLEQNPVYTVAGTTDLTGYNWDATKNEMTLNAETGLYEWTAKLITVNAENQPEFKVVKNYKEWYPGDSEGNWVITPDYLGGAGLYTITITFNAETKVIGVAGAKREEPIYADNNVYYWNSPDGYVDQNGGTAVASDGQSVNYANADYYTIRLNGDNKFTSAIVTITLDQALKAGDKINITAYRNKNGVDKKSGAKLKFNDAKETTLTTGEGLEFVNIDSSEESVGDKNRGTEPNTITLEVPEDADGSTTITLTRSQTQTALFITMLEITRPEPAPVPDVYTVAGDVALTGCDWDETKNEMTLNADGLYEWTAENITVSASDQPEFKVVKNGDWATAWPAENFVISPDNDNLEGEGVYTITIYFNAEDNVVSMTGVKTGEIIPEPDVYTVAGSKGLTGTINDWEIADDNNMELNAVGIYEWKREGVTVTDDIKPEFKVVKNAETANEVWIPASEGQISHNWVITLGVLGDAAGDYTITITYDPEKGNEGIAVTGVRTGDATGINNIATADSRQDGAAIYNLNGQRVQNAQKGLYIVNGRKVVLK